MLKYVGDYLDIRI